MNPSDAPRFAQVLASVAETLNVTLSTARIEGYWLVLRDLDLEAFERGATIAMRECRFFPVPIELRELAELGYIRSPEARQQALWLAEAVRQNDALVAAEREQSQLPARRAIGRRADLPGRLGDALLSVVPRPRS